MKDMLKEIQKLLPLHGNLRQMLNLGSPGSPPTKQYEVASKVELVPTSQVIVRQPNREKTPVLERTQSCQVRRNGIERSARSRWTQSPMLERANTPQWTKTPDRVKAPIAQALQPPTPDGMIVEQWGHPPSHTLTVRERRTTSTPCSRNMKRRRRTIIRQIRAA